MDIVRDDMIFEPYEICGGYQCRMQVKSGTISVRFGGHGLITSNEKPYEVWYPDQDSPIGYQTAEDIWNYIKSSDRNLNHNIMYHFEVIKNTKTSWLDYFRHPQRYHWRIRHYGDIIATSETYNNYDDALAVATHLQSKIKGATIKTIVE